MFGSLGLGEILTLLVVGLIVFGPDKLPQVARDAARVLRQLRAMAQGASGQLRSELGPEFADLDLDSLNPKTFVRKHLLGDESLVDDIPRVGEVRLDASPPQPTSRAGERPPFDPDTT
jgi:sec-independent protein translocase protein TatB